eukprot:CAMPEP_0170896104 /NCGR_PEP_ID=MMETSP0734-20130129/44573_1 /TAXON_ID=186038 /ORGANISM="Fragilariopsis kerguelensis, Strain L26-C5" /LENGTH=544 /DNA_ID=CAMNT_0011288237 /DNA_START=71 /DNA_END=1701 /DNA_ORIENTATION=+
MRYDLAFFLCCCKSFLGSDESSDYTNFYDLLDIERDATNDEIKKAYKRKSLQMHPDKLAQHGKVITEEDQSKFTRMKEAYEILSDQHKRDTYDVIGERGMKWIEEPFAMDPQELARNFSKSSIVDRSKIFAIFVGLVVATTILPIMVCLHVDGVLGDNAPWLATLTPLWLWNFFVLFYHSRDNLVVCNWVVIFIPLYIWEATTLLKKWPLARLRIVTVDDLETAMGKPFVEFTTEEKELIGKRYSVVVSTTSTDFEIAQKLKERARKDMMKCIFRIIFITILIVQLDTSIELNWWIVFTPFWIMTFLICVTNYQVFAEVQLMAVEKDPTLFGLSSKQEGGNNSTNNNYGSVGDGAATPEATSTAAAASLQSELTEDEREELKAQVINGGSKLCSKCCSQGLLLILMLLVLAKLQGAGFSSLWIISPFLLASGIILCCLGCAIFGISEVPSEGIVDSGHFVGLVDGSAEATDGTVASPSPIIIDSNNASLSVVSTEPSLIDTEIGGRENSLLPSSQQIATPIIEPTPVQDQSLIESKGTMELREL